MLNRYLNLFLIASKGQLNKTQKEKKKVHFRDFMTPKNLIFHALDTNMNKSEMRGKKTDSSVQTLTKQLVNKMEFVIIQWDNRYS